MTRTRTYTRDDVQTHYDYSRGGPAVNVKVYQDFRAVFHGLPDSDLSNPHFTLEWVERHCSDEYLDSLFWETCADEWEQIEQDAEGIFGPHVSVEQQGRSGGWAVVHGLPDIEDWDAIRLAKWRKFERYARQIADGVPYQMLARIYDTDFRAWVEA